MRIKDGAIHRIVADSPGWADGIRDSVEISKFATSASARTISGPNG
jgi:hypothetical protein